MSLIQKAFHSACRYDEGNDIRSTTTAAATTTTTTTTTTTLRLYFDSHGQRKAISKGTDKIL